MTDVVRLGPVTPPGATGHHGGTAGHAGRTPAFHDAVRAALHVPLAVPHPRRAENPVSIIPARADAALQQAMDREGVPQSWQSGLRYIMAQESGGRVDVQSPVHSARGLFQLTAAQYHLNPNGVKSFGNAVEEAQGGIRYIKQRYGTADNAVAFWKQHQWY